MISSQSVPLLAILASSLTLTCLSLIKSTLYPNLVIFISKTNFNAFKIHWHVSLQTLQNINTSHQHSKNYTGFLSNKESITKSAFSHTKHLKNQQPTYFYNSLSFPSHSVSTRSSDSLVLSIPYDRSSLGKRVFSVIGPTTLEFTPSGLIPETCLLYQYSVPGSKYTSSKLRSLPRLFPISLDCLPGTRILILAILILCPIE